MLDTPILAINVRLVATQPVAMVCLVTQVTNHANNVFVNHRVAPPGKKVRHLRALRVPPDNTNPVIHSRATIVHFVQLDNTTTQMRNLDVLVVGQGNIKDQKDRRRVLIAQSVFTPDRTHSRHVLLAIRDNTKEQKGNRLVLLAIRDSTKMPINKLDAKIVPKANIQIQTNKRRVNFVNRDNTNHPHHLQPLVLAVQKDNILPEKVYPVA